MSYRIAELEQLQNEKRNMLMERETMKFKSQDDESIVWPR